jgi:hypothetical protein
MFQRRVGQAFCLKRRRLECVAAMQVPATLSIRRHRTPNRYHAEYGGNVAQRQAIGPDRARKNGPCLFGIGP